MVLELLLMPFVASLPEILLKVLKATGFHIEVANLFSIICVCTWLVTNEILSSLEKREKYALEVTALLRQGFPSHGG